MICFSRSSFQLFADLQSGPIKAISNVKSDSAEFYAVVPTEANSIARTAPAATGAADNANVQGDGAEENKEMHLRMA